MDFESLAHTADLKIRAYGVTLEELFANSVVGMFQSIHPKSTACSYINERMVCGSLPITRAVAVQATELDFLLIDFLSTCLYFSAVHKEAYLKVIVHSITTTTISAELYGVAIQGFEVEIKAVTYHDTHILKHNDLWQVDIVFDI